MIRTTEIRFIAPDAYYYELAGLSTDTKPTDNVATGSVFVEVDTGDVFLFDEVGGEWNKVGGSDE